MFPDEELLVFDHEIAAPVEDVFGAYLNPNCWFAGTAPAGWFMCAPPTLSWSPLSAVAASVHDQRVDPGVPHSAEPLFEH